MELGAEINITCRSPQVGAEVIPCRTYSCRTSIAPNGAVYVIGGFYDYEVDEYKNTKMEIWKIEDSPDQFKTKENWPELFDWSRPHLFIVPDSFFPDY